MSELNPARREQIQAKITKVILEDGGKEKLDQIIAVNELSESDAKELIKEAKKERVDIIRGGYLRNVWIGSAVLSLGIGCAYVIAMMTGELSLTIKLLSGFIMLLGVGMVVASLLGIIFASLKKGAVE